MKKKIFVRAPVLSQSGYGEQSRFALRALKTKEDIFDIYIQPIPWGQTGWIWQDSEFRTWMDSRITITQVLLEKKQLQPDVSLQITIPNEFQKFAPVNIGYTAGIETTKAAPVWIQKGNEMDKVLVVSNHAMNTYKNTLAQATNSETGEVVPYRLNTPIHVVGESTPREDPEPIHSLKLDYEFNFLMVSQMSVRKNFDNSLRWWVEEFHDQEVGLVVKTNLATNCIIDFEYVEKKVETALAKYTDRKCKVYLLHGDLTAGQMTWLYNHEKLKSLINISHGEGFGLPMFEAAREGMPIVSVEWSGQTDFLSHDDKNYFQSVDYTLGPIQPEAVWDGVLEKESMWAYADQGSYKMKLRKMYKDWESNKETSLELQKIISDKFSDDKLYQQFCSHFYSKEEEELANEINSLFDELND